MADRGDRFTKQPHSTEGSAREAHGLSAVQGAGIVALHDVGDDGELVLARAACSLADVLHERGRLSDGEVRAVGAAAAAALARVHEAGLVHGDIKPANLLLSHDGDLWLADFDTASAGDGQPLRRFSPGRLPPGAPARPGTDMASLALTLVELSTGTRLDPVVPWRAADLRRLGCSPALSAEISLMLGGADSAPDVQAAAQMFERGDVRSLPAPAVNARRVDPTPTIEFMPARTAPAQSPARSSPEAARETRPRWQRLAREGRAQHLDEANAGETRPWWQRPAASWGRR